MRSMGLECQGKMLSYAAVNTLCDANEASLKILEMPYADEAFFIAVLGRIAMLRFSICRHRL